MIAIDSVVDRQHQAPVSAQEICTEVDTQSLRSGISRRRSDALGNSKLCSTCTFLFSNPLRSIGADNLHANSSPTTTTTYAVEPAPFHSLEKLAVQAVKGCHLCLQVYLGLDPEALKTFSKHLRSNSISKRALDGSRSTTRGQTSRETSQGFVFIVPQGGNGARLSFAFTKPAVTAPEIVKLSKSISLRVEFHLVKTQQLVNHYSCPVPANSTSTASDESFNTARQWIKDCSDSHVKCSTSFKVDWKPTHLLQVGLRDSRNNLGIRLVDSVSVKPDSEYVTLSHCWGSSKAVRLHKKTLPALRQGVMCASLPQSLADAALVAQRLGYEYIWIDALCIMHDDEEAVLHEMVQMDQIYESAALNIAATCASSDSEGFLRPRNTDALQPCKVNVKHHCIEDGMYSIFRSSTWHDSVDKSPLARRAWVFQERALARRTLHFTRHELMWECSQHCCSETYTADMLRQTETLLPQILESHDEHGCLSASANFTRELHTEQDVAWNELVEMYSTRKLTHGSDRLIAISGLAQQYMRRHGLTSNEYIAGLWRSELPYSLLWRANNGQRVSRYRAPTWSWASMDGQIICPSMWDASTEPCVTVAEVEMRHKYGDVFGFCKSAQLTLSGFLARAFLPQKQHHKEMSTCSLRFPDAIVEFQAVSFDEDRTLQSSAAKAGKTIDTLEVSVLPVLCTPEKIQGLLLKAIPGSSHFRRMGTFELVLKDPTNQTRIRRIIENGVEGSALDKSPESTDLLLFSSGDRQLVTLV